MKMAAEITLTAKSLEFTQSPRVFLQTGAAANKRAVLGRNSIYQVFNLKKSIRSSAKNTNIFSKINNSSVVPVHVPAGKFLVPAFNYQPVPAFWLGTPPVKCRFKLQDRRLHLHSKYRLFLFSVPAQRLAPEVRSECDFRYSSTKTHRYNSHQIIIVAPALFWCYKVLMSRQPQSNIASLSREALDSEFLKELPWLSENQIKCLIFIWKYYLKNRHSPTHREIVREMGITSNTADMYLKPLEHKGYIVRVPGRTRNIKLTQDAVEKLKLEGVNVEAR